ncbi:MAG: FHA domain-containing protein [Anaerolineales bacterium]|nr:FHA domain-containing protein [Anaerolineales bacterium]
MNELLCPIHGPYDASHGTCPYCANPGGRPPAPPPLGDDFDDLPTDIGAAYPAASPGRGYGDDELPTELGGNAPGPGLSFDDIDPTEVGRVARDHFDETELDFVDDSLLGILWVKESRMLRRGQIFKIKDGTVVGRSRGDLVVDDPKASNPHAKFRVQGEAFIIGDMMSKNGTQVNGNKIDAATLLAENDEIKIGETVFVLKVLI